MKKIYILLLFIIFIFTGCVDKSSDSYKFKQEYESLNNTIREKDGKKIRSISIPKDNHIKYLTCDEMINKMDNNETFVVYFGFSDCPWCRSVLPTLLDVVSDNNLKTLYYIDVSNIRDILTVDKTGQVVTTKEGDSGYLKILDRLNSILKDYTLKGEAGNVVETNEKRIYAPNIVSIIKGTPYELVDGISKLQTDGYMNLTSKMQEETYDIFNNFLEPVIADLSTCEIDKEC